MHKQPAADQHLLGSDTPTRCTNHVNTPHTHSQSQSQSQSTDTQSGCILQHHMLRVQPNTTRAKRNQTPWLTDPTHEVQLQNTIRSINRCKDDAEPQDNAPEGRQQSRQPLQCAAGHRGPMQKIPTHSSTPNKMAWITSCSITNNTVLQPTARRHAAGCEAPRAHMTGVLMLVAPRAP